MDVFKPVRLPHFLHRRHEAMECIAQYQVLNGCFLLIGELEAVAGENLYAVVLIRVCEAEMTMPAFGPHALGNESDSRVGRTPSK